MQTYLCPYQNEGCEFQSTAADDIDEHVELEHDDDYDVVNHGLYRDLDPDDIEEWSR